MVRIPGQIFRQCNTKLFRSMGILFVVFILVATFLFYVNTETEFEDLLFNGDETLLETYLFTQNTNNSISAKDGVWQIVGGKRHKLYIFSAYYDWRVSQRMVRIIGIVRSENSAKLWCLFWYNTTDNSDMLPVRARVELLEENWFLNYSASFIKCPLTDEMDAPHSVSIVEKSNLTTSKRLLVNNAYPGLRPKPPPSPDKLAVCVKPLHFNYNKTLQMLEFIELNTILGMHHFTFYNSSISPTTSCILNHYIREGRVTVYPWELDLVSQREIRTEGMFAAINDCIYRSMYRFRLVAQIDMDEIIMPRRIDTIHELMNLFDKLMGSHPSYVFQNAFFYLQWPDDSELSDEPFERKITTLRKTRRRTELQSHRSKYICHPEMVIEAGNHVVWNEFTPNGTFPVPDSLALLHHYRVCEDGGDNCTELLSTTDRTAHRYKTRLLERVKAKWTELKTECSLPNIEDYLN